MQIDYGKIVKSPSNRLEDLDLIRKLALICVGKDNEELFNVKRRTKS